MAAPDDLQKNIQGYDIPDDLKEVVHRIATDAEDMDLRLSEYKFIHSTRMVGVAVGGAVFVLGVIFILVSIFLFFNVFELTLAERIMIPASSFMLVVGITQLLAGILLISR